MGEDWAGNLACLMCQCDLEPGGGTGLDSLVNKDTYCREVLADILTLEPSRLGRDPAPICGPCLFRLINYWEYRQKMEQLAQEVRGAFDMSQVHQGEEASGQERDAAAPRVRLSEILAANQFPVDSSWHPDECLVDNPEYWRHLIGPDETKCDIILRTKILRSRFPNCLFLACETDTNLGIEAEHLIHNGSKNIKANLPLGPSEAGNGPAPMDVKKYCCANKICGFTLWTLIRKRPWNKRNVEQHQVELLSHNRPNHSQDGDEARHRFEMSRQEFILDRVCEFCCQEFRTDQEFEDHGATHGKSDKIASDSSCVYFCPTLGCAKKFATFQSRNLHYLAIHTTDSPYKCQKCDKRFKAQAKFKDHIKKCILGQRFPCQMCSKVFLSQRNLREHMSVIHCEKQENEEEKPFPCPKCPKRFHKKHNMTYHMVTHSKDRRYRCIVQDCLQLFKRERALKSHMESQHSKKKPAFLCVYCGRSFESLSGMKTHMKLHTGEEYIKRKVSCPTCHKKFQCPSDLKIHSVVHTKEKPFVCTVCKLGFSQRASLKDHNNVHLNKFQCHYCSRSFGRERYLKSHLKACPMIKEAELDDATVDLHLRGLGSLTSSEDPLNLGGTHHPAPEDTGLGKQALLNPSRDPASMSQGDRIQIMPTPPIQPSDARQSPVDNLSLSGIPDATVNNGCPSESPNIVLVSQCHPNRGPSTQTLVFSEASFRRSESVGSIQVAKSKQSGEVSHCRRSTNETQVLCQFPEGSGSVALVHYVGMEPPSQTCISPME